MPSAFDLIDSGGGNGSGAQTDVSSTTTAAFLGTGWASRQTRARESTRKIRPTAIEKEVSCLSLTLAQRKHADRFISIDPLGRERPCRVKENNSLS